MWKWEQGRLEYFQFDELRKMAKFGVGHNLRQADRATLETAVGLPFSPDDSRYRPWRNYGRVFQVTMLATPRGRNYADMTVIGNLLAQDGKVTTDEYLHFLASATTDPTPALSSWDHTVTLRYPLLFVLRFLLARATQDSMETRISEIVHAYEASQFVGDEDDTSFLGIIFNTGNVASPNGARQANESIKVLAQLSYLTARRDTIMVSLDREDAQDLFYDLTPVGGPPQRDRAKEIARRADLFPSAIAEMKFEYPASIVSNVGEAGFASSREGDRVRKTHLTIERNQMIRWQFFEENPSHECNLCSMNTKRLYPWTDRLLEVHHLLPLCSGARTSNDGTLLEDLVANCPTCHRAVHRYYDKWLGKRDQLDFADADEAKEAYAEAKHKHRATA